MLAARERQLTRSGRAGRLNATLQRCDPTNEIGAAWAVKERLRLLLGEREPSKIRWRLSDFYDAAIDAARPGDVVLLAPGTYDGGILQFRNRATGAILGDVSNTGAGDALLSALNQIGQAAAQPQHLALDRSHGRPVIILHKNANHQQAWAA